MDTLPPLAEVDDLLLRLGREAFGDLEEARAEAVLNDASEFVREESGSLWLDPLDLTKVKAPRIVQVITVRVAERATRNPEGFSSESAGDYSYQRNGAVGEGGLYLTERELKMLRKAGGKTGMWNQQITRGEEWDETEWVPDQYGCDPIPMGTIPRWGGY